MTNCVGTFDYAIQALLGVEGGLNTDPEDDGNRNGGATNYGMTQPFYDAYRTRVLRVSPQPVRLASAGEARLAYYELVWMDRKVNAQAVARLAPITAFIYFDGAVNHGGLMTRELQREVGMVGDEVDGWCGAATLAAVKAAVKRIGDDGLAARLLTRRKSIYVHHRDYAHFGRGWRNRLNDLASRSGLAWHWHT